MEFSYLFPILISFKITTFLLLLSSNIGKAAELWTLSYSPILVLPMYWSSSWSWQLAIGEVKLVDNYQLYLSIVILHVDDFEFFFPWRSLCVPNEACWDGEVEVLSRLMFADCVEIAGEWGSLIQPHQSGFHFYLNCCFRAEIFWQGYNVFYSAVTRKHEIMIPPGFMSASQQHAVKRVEE